MVFSCKFAAYFQNTFSYEYLWMAASEYPVTPVIIPIISIPIFYCFEEEMLRSVEVSSFIRVQDKISTYNEILSSFILSQNYQKVCQLPHERSVKKTGRLIANRLSAISFFLKLAVLQR